MVEKVWASLSSGAMVNFAVLLLLSIPVNGLGVVLNEGKFELRQGLFLENVDQGFGLILYCMGVLTLVSLVAALALSAWILAVHGSLRPSDVLAEPGLRSFATCLRVAAGILAVSVLIYVANGS